MYLKYSLGFLVASLVQAGIILFTETFGLSTLGITMTATQILIHVITGQFVGYILLFTMIKVKAIGTANVWVIGSSTGVIAWFVLLSLNSGLGKVNAPWTQGYPTILASLIAFITLGLIATYTIKRYGYERVEA